MFIEAEEDTKGQRTLKNIMICDIKSATSYFASACKDVKMTTLSKSCKKLMLCEDPDLDFTVLEPNDFHQTLLCAGERGQCRRC